MASFGFLPRAPSASLPKAPQAIGKLQIPSPGGATAARAFQPGVTGVASKNTFRPGLRRPALTSAGPPGIVLDSTLGQVGQPVITLNAQAARHYQVDAQLGKQSGGNLFFSFSRFGLATNESATFTSVISLLRVRNILARVSGSWGASIIDGMLQCDIAGANLFLMNPAGFIFREHAALDVRGSLAITTADYLQLADGSRFSALPSPADAALSASPVATFGFAVAKPAAVTFKGSGSSPTELKVADGATFSIAAGDQFIDGTTLLAPAGRMRLVSVAGQGDVPYESSTSAPGGFQSPRLGTISLTNFATASAVTTDQSGAGSLQIDARTIRMTDSFLDVSVLRDAPAPGAPPSSLLLRSDSLQMNGSTILGDALFSGRGGNLDLRAREMILSNASSISSTATDQAASGHIKLTTGTLALLQSSIKTSTSGTGGAGEVDVNARAVRIVGGLNSAPAGILAEGGSSFDAPAGPGGEVRVTADSIILENGGQVSARTFGPGNGGRVLVAAQNILISGFAASGGSILPSGIFASSDFPGGLGAGGVSGDIHVRSHTLRLMHGGQISTSTSGSGDGANSSIFADRLVLDGSGTALRTGLFATTGFVRGGKGGDLAVTAGIVQIKGGAEINASTQGTGAGGDIAIRAPRLVLSGEGSRIAAQTLAPMGGAGGAIRIEANSVAVRDGATISASTRGSGSGGSITIHAQDVVINSASVQADTSGFSGTVTVAPFVHDVRLALGLDHSANADLGATLFAPDQSGASASIQLFHRGDLQGANLDTTLSDNGALLITSGTAPYSGTYTPVEPLRFLQGAYANGIWDLRVQDFAAGHAGTLRTWSLQVNGTTFVSSSSAMPIKDFDAASFRVAVTLPSLRTHVNAGAGGNVQITASHLTLRHGGTVSATTLGSGAAGALSIRADSVNVDAGRDVGSTGFFADAATGSSGRGGTIFIETKQFLASGSRDSTVAGVAARSATSAGAGDIVLRVEDVLLDRGATITSANTGTGPAGSVSLAATDAIVLQGSSSVTALSGSSDAGTISLIAGHAIELHDHSTVTASAGANGGSIDVSAGDLFFLDHSSLAATAGTSLPAGSRRGGAGSGGNITIDPVFVILDHGSISANAALGVGGNIALQAENFFSSGSAVTATGVSAGTITISAPELDVANGLSQLSGAFIDASTQLRELCAQRLGNDFSSFLLLGQGGIQERPDDPVATTDDREPAKRKRQ